MDLVKKSTPKLVKELERIALKGEPDTARVAAMKELLDRGYGRPVQAHTLSDPDGDPVQMIHRVENVIVDPDEED